MGCKPEDYPAFLKLVFRLSNIHGALVTMPHKVTTMGLLDEVSTNARVAGSCNAIKLGADGKLIGDMFDGEGFVRGLLRRGQQLAGAEALVVGAGGVGSAIAASLASAGVRRIALHDDNTATLNGLRDRLNMYYPSTEVTVGSADPFGFDIVVNATPLGMRKGDPLPVDVSRLAPSTFVGEVVMKQEITPLLEAARGLADALFRSAPTCCSSRSPPTSISSDSRAPPRRNCVPSPGSARSANWPCGRRHRLQAGSSAASIDAPPPSQSATKISG